MQALKYGPKQAPDNAKFKGVLAVGALQGAISLDAPTLFEEVQQFNINLALLASVGTTAIGSTEL
jgi:hypothetical protein